jgi:ParB family chromosome partitioning protein
MAADPKRPALGRGLSALLGEDTEDYAQLDRLRTSRTVAIHLLRPSPFQPRRHMQEAELADLAQSIAAKGVLQPLLVRRIADDPQAFEIVAGERRWRAAQMAQLHEVPIVIKELSDREALEIALIENLQRQDLTALEEAQGYRRLMDDFEHTQDALARAIGKSRSHVANTLRLLSLPDSVKRLLDDGSLSAGHARTLVGVEDADALAEQIVKRGLNVRQTERLIAQHRSQPAAASEPEPAPAKDADTLALERDLSALLGLKAEIRFKRGGGALVLHYSTLEQLDELLHRLRRGGSDENEAGGY